jgi:TRAP-type uncharacterized transport system fused permease subunit
VTIVLSLRHQKALELALMLLSVLCISYYIWKYRDLADRSGAWMPTDLGVAWVAVLLALEVARRALGLWIPAIAIGVILYGYFGREMPASIAHGGESFEGIVNFILYPQDGIFGVMTNVMAQFVLIFIYLGAFMQS